MISRSHVRTMAAYNRWQNDAIYAAAATLDEKERMRDRGAFFGSIHGTLAHILWADHVWLSRFDKCARPGVLQKDSASYGGEWAAMRAARHETDVLMESWTASLDEAALASVLEWFSGSSQQHARAPVWVVATHLFNHQTHHRGQVHAMLTAAGVRTEDTDLFLMPRARWPRDDHDKALDESV